MANRVLLEKEIKDYCNVNNISDIPGFITQCLLQGFNIYRYGTSPQNNKDIENNKIEVKVSNREKKQNKPSNIDTPKIEYQDVEKNKIEEIVKPEVKVTKRKIRIISND